MNTLPPVRKQCARREQRTATQTAHRRGLGPSNPPCRSAAHPSSPARSRRTTRTTAARMRRTTTPAASAGVRACAARGSGNRLFLRLQHICRPTLPGPIRPDLIPLLASPPPSAPFPPPPPSHSLRRCARALDARAARQLCARGRAARRHSVSFLVARRRSWCGCLVVMLVVVVIVVVV